MELKQLLSDDRAVSPVIGVILMVAITVILAAVIGTFVLGLGGQVGNNAPSATFNYEYENISSGSGTQYVNITKQAGEPIESENVNVSIGSDTLETGTVNNATNIEIASSSSTWPETVTAGDKLTVTDTSSGTIPTDTDVQLIWKSGGSSSIISSSTTPV